jgi:hypothetical protein
VETMEEQKVVIKAAVVEGGMEVEEGELHTQV